MSTPFFDVDAIIADRQTKIMICCGAGGVGKTTITTNLASYFASRDVTTTIADFDPQGSSLNWLLQRSGEARKIYGASCGELCHHRRDEWAKE